jgi:very-short-patch-repair endonuclease
MIEIARQFRKEPTPSEAILWKALRKQQVEGRKFRRQQPIGRFVVDFFCASEWLIVEIDGGIHELQKNLDHQRQQLLESFGLRFLRVSSEQVETDIAGVLVLICSIWNHPHR